MRKSRYLKIAAHGLKPVPPPIRGMLVLVDARPIRADATKKYRAAKTRFADIQRLISRFHDDDKPKFERWLQSVFGGLVGELRTTQGELNRLRELIFEVETRTWFNNQSCAAAYRDVLDRQARRRDNPSAPNDDDLEEKMRAHLEAEARDEQEEAAAREAGTSLRRPHHLTPEKESRLKAAYRSMARRLHPDRHANVTPQMRERWHAAQQAYLAGDVDLLESMETMCHDEEEEVSAETPVSFILDRTRRLAASIAQLATKAQHSRRDPAWGFSELTDLSRIKRFMAKTLPHQIKTAREEIVELEEKITQWQTDAERFYPGFKEAHPEVYKKKGKAEAAAAKAEAAKARSERPAAKAPAKGAASAKAKASPRKRQAA